MMEITKRLVRGTHKCQGFPTADDVYRERLKEGTEVTCSECGQVWVLMELMTYSGWPWRRRRDFQWVVPGRTDD